MNITDIQKEFRKEFYAYATHDRLDKESFSDWADKFLRTAVERAFEKAKREGFTNKEIGESDKWDKAYCHGYNNALAEIKFRQDKFMGKE